MAFEIMDGHTGKAHVTSDDVAVFNEALYGHRDCVLPYADDLTLTISSTGAAVLASGAGLVDGRRFVNRTASAAHGSRCRA